MTMPTMYQLDMYKRYAIGALIFALLVIFSGNIISYFFLKKIHVTVMLISPKMAFLYSFQKKII
jgi:hypothetical protein